MNRQQIMNELSDAFTPSRVWAYPESWGFVVETEPTRLFHIAEEWATAATEGQLEQIVSNVPAGEYLVTAVGTLVPVKVAST